MKPVELVRHPNNRLDIVAGLIDGLLTALALASGRLIHGNGDGATLSLALRISVAAGATTIFVFFVAHYAELRLELVRHERQLNFTEHGRLAATSLGRRAFFDALSKAILASVCSLLGALFPLLLCILLPSPKWLGLAITIVALGALGALLAKTFYGSPLLWGLCLLAGGVALALIGVKVDLVG
jgi:predicted membrane protein (TIGR00267 family)